MASHVDKIECSVTGTGYDLAVQSFELSVAVNSIPSITIEALPIQRSDKGVKATAPKYREITELYNELSEKARTYEIDEATIDIKITSSDPEEKVQKMKLTPWILTDVGLSTVTTYAAPTLTLVFKHRIAKLDRFGTIYEDVSNPNELNKMYLEIDGETVIDIMKDVYEKYANEDPVKFFSIAPIDKDGMKEEYKDFVVKIRQQLETFQPRDYLNPQGGLFLNPSGIDPVLLKAAIAKIVSPVPFSTTTFVSLVNTIAPVTLAQIVPKYYNRELEYEPIEPWQKYTLELDSKKIEAIDVVSMDPDPLIGAAEKKTFDHTEMVVDERTRVEVPVNASDPECPTYAAFIPDKVLQEDITKLKGHMDYYAENSIIGMAVHDDFGRNTGQDKIDEIENAVQPEDEANAEKLVMQAMYAMNYKKLCKASVTSMPTFTDINNNIIIPGRVVTAKDEDSKLMFYGYLSRMTIKGSTSGGGCSYYEFTHARPTEDGGGEKNYLPEGTKNDCYEDFTPTVDPG